jgi:tetratricopeptide (TPR) repeat protein
MSSHDEIARLETQVQSRPGDPAVAARLAVAYARTGAFDRRDELVRKTRSRIEACLRLGLKDAALEAAKYLYDESGDPESLATLVEVVISLPDLEEAARLLDSLGEKQLPLEISVKLALLALAANRPEIGRRLVEPVAATRPEAHAVYVQTLLSCGDAESASSEARAALELWWGHDRRPRGGAAVGKSLETDPSSVDLHLLLGVAELSAGRIGSAIDALSEAMRLAPERPESYYNLGLALIESGSHAAALGIIDAGLDLAPHDPRLLAARNRLDAPHLADLARRFEAARDKGVVAADGAVSKR